MAGYSEKVIDFRESLSPISLLKVSQALERMKPLEILEIRGSDVHVREDLYRLLPQKAYEIIHDEESDTEAGLYTVRIRKSE